MHIFYSTKVSFEFVVDLLLFLLSFKNEQYDLFGLLVILFFYRINHERRLDSNTILYSMIKMLAISSFQLFLKPDVHANGDHELGELSHIEFFNQTIILYNTFNELV